MGKSYSSKSTALQRVACVDKIYCELTSSQLHIYIDTHYQSVHNMNLSLTIQQHEWTCLPATRYYVLCASIDRQLGKNPVHTYLANPLMPVAPLDIHASCSLSNGSVAFWSACLDFIWISLFVLWVQAMTCV